MYPLNIVSPSTFILFSKREFVLENVDYVTQIIDD